MRLIVATTRHTPYPRKTTARAAFDAALEEAHQAGADDAVLLTTAGLVAEGTVWNLFWWEDDGVGTPPLSLGILPGVGRDRVRDLVSVTERAVGVDELRSKSLFAINAVRGVIAIASFEGMGIPPDARTAELGARFWP
jgi:branched-subunit amino acid aminotransferase/4-amino-4-deoxychorismate lyase